jgi:hypothetical protein
VPLCRRYSADVAVRHSGDAICDRHFWKVEITATGREPHSGHLRRLSRPAIGNAAPRVQTSVFRSSSAFPSTRGRASSPLACPKRSARDAPAELVSLADRLASFASHETVNHSREEYVRGHVHTNTVEGYYSIFKRGMKGAYQHLASGTLTDTSLSSISVIPTVSRSAPGMLPVPMSRSRTLPGSALPIERLITEVSPRKKRVK